MNKDEQLLEIYKLHAQLADNVSQRRAAANRFYLALLSGVFALFAALARGEEALAGWVLVAAGMGGFAMSVAWLVNIRSYRQLNSGKFKILLQLEENLPFDFFRREWKELGEGADARRYRLLTRVESLAPWIFAAAYLGMAVAGALKMAASAG